MFGNVHNGLDLLFTSCPLFFCVFLKQLSNFGTDDVLDETQEVHAFLSLHNIVFALCVFCDNWLTAPASPDTKMIRAGGS